MTRAISLTGDDLIRALTEAATPTADRAARQKADAVARELTADGVVARVRAGGDGVYAVSVEGAGIFEREFGSIEHEADPFVVAAIDRARGA